SAAAARVVCIASAARATRATIPTIANRLVVPSRSTAGRRPIRIASPESGGAPWRFIVPERAPEGGGRERAEEGGTRPSSRASVLKPLPFSPPPSALRQTAATTA